MKFIILSAILLLGCSASGPEISSPSDAIAEYTEPFEVHKIGTICTIGAVADSLDATAPAEYLVYAVILITNTTNETARAVLRVHSKDEYVVDPHNLQNTFQSHQVYHHLIETHDISPEESEKMLIPIQWTRNPTQPRLDRELWLKMLAVDILGVKYNSGSPDGTDALFPFIGYLNYGDSPESGQKWELEAQFQETQGLTNCDPLPSDMAVAQRALCVDLPADYVRQGSSFNLRVTGPGETTSWHIIPDNTINSKKQKLVLRVPSQNAVEKGSFTAELFIYNTVTILQQTGGVPKRERIASDLASLGWEILPHRYTDSEHRVEISETDWVTRWNELHMK